MKIRHQRKIKEKIPLLLLFLLMVYSHYLLSMHGKKLENQLDVLRERGSWMGEITTSLQEMFPSADWPELPDEINNK